MLLKCRVGLKSPVLEPSLLVVVTANWGKEDTERKVVLPLVLNYCELKTSLSPFPPAINKAGNNIFLVCKYSLRIC